MRFFRPWLPRPWFLAGKQTLFPFPLSARCLEIGWGKYRSPPPPPRIAGRKCQDHYVWRDRSTFPNALSPCGVILTSPLLPLIPASYLIHLFFTPGCFSRPRLRFPPPLNFGLDQFRYSLNIFLSPCLFRSGHTSFWVLLLFSPPPIRRLFRSSGFLRKHVFLLPPVALDCE